MICTCDKNKQSVCTCVAEECWCTNPDLPCDCDAKRKELYDENATPEPDRYWACVIPFEQPEAAHSAACEVLEQLGYKCRVMMVDADRYEFDGTLPGQEPKGTDHE